MRGSHARDFRFGSGKGSIPASAGQPARLLPRPSMRSVYPRECGAADTGFFETRGVTGLSPRVRGSHSCSRGDDRRRRSIPASAGQPLDVQRRGRRQQVYPRECGAAEIDRQNALAQEGLSPRVRGSRGAWAAVALKRGSIPASAGQPSRRKTSSRLLTVYPRECGAAQNRRLRTMRRIGLSPRVRGSHC